MNFVVTRSGVRLDKLVADAAGCGRRRAGQWIREGRVRLDDHFAVAATLASRGQNVSVDMSEPAVPSMPVADADAVTILLRQGDLMAVAKPAGLHTHQGRGQGSVAESLQQAMPELAHVGARPEEGGIVHRLDRDTSGVLLVATAAAEYRRLRALFREGAVRKEYLALACGELTDRLTIDTALARRTSRVVAAGRHDRALPALTEVEPLEVGDAWTLVHVHMRTGVTHQVRAHMALAGYPLLGDTLYGGPPAPGPRQGQLLHALRIRVADEVDVASAPAGDFVAAYAALRR